MLLDKEVDVAPTSDVWPNAGPSLVQTLRSGTERAPLPLGWEFLRTSRWVRRLSSEPAELQRRLEEKHPIAQLAAAGMLVPDRHGEHQLSPVLTASAFVIDRDADGVPTGIVSMAGTLSADQPWMELARLQQKPVVQSTQRVLLTWCENDFDLLRRLGFRTLSASGLEAISAAQVQQIFEAGEPWCGGKYHHDFVLVGWRVTERRRLIPDSLRPTLHHLVRIDRSYGIDTSRRFKVWLPTNEANRSIDDAVHLRDRPLLVRTLTSSIDNSLAPADALIHLSDLVQLDYVQARQRLQRVIERSEVVPLFADVKVALQQFQKAARRDVLDQLDARAAAASDVERLIGLSTEELAELYFSTHPLVGAAKRILAGEHPRYQPSLDDDDLPQRLRLIDAIAKLARGDRRH
jgi:hypothetical protein